MHYSCASFTKHGHLPDITAVIRGEKTVSKFETEFKLISDEMPLYTLAGALLLSNCRKRREVLTDALNPMKSFAFTGILTSKLNREIPLLIFLKSVSPVLDMDGVTMLYTPGLLVSSRQMSNSSFWL